MPSYEICYLHEDGSLMGHVCADAVSDKHAKILAHAMRLPGARAMEVWCGDALVYARPERTEGFGLAIFPDAAVQNGVRRAAA
jgi:hypothetical protein